MAVGRLGVWKGVCGCEFLNVVQLGYCDGVLLER